MYGFIVQFATLDDCVLDLSMPLRIFNQATDSLIFQTLSYCLKYCHLEMLLNFGVTKVK